MSRRHILITGATGYLGSLTIQELAKMIQSEEQGDLTVIALDVREVPTEKRLDGITYLCEDIRSPNLATIVADYHIDTIVHLASIVTPGKKSNREFEYSVDVLGTKNVLEAAVASGVRRIIVTSSGAAYGYHEDNPAWLREEDAIRGNEEFAYSYHKRLVEELLAEYRINHPQLEQVVFRVGTILGATVRNQITNLFEKKRMFTIRGSESPFVFIWDQDVVGAILKAIDPNSKAGIYNVAGDGTLSLPQIANILGKSYISIPPTLVKWGLYVFKKLGLSQYGPEQIRFLQYRPVLDNTQLKTVFGYTPAKTTMEAFAIYQQARFGSQPPKNSAGG